MTNGFTNDDFNVDGDLTVAGDVSITGSIKGAAVAYATYEGGGTPTSPPTDSYNITSVVINTSIATVTLSVTMADLNYVVIPNVPDDADYRIKVYDKANTSFKIQITTSGTPVVPITSFVVFGDKT